MKFSIIRILFFVLGLSCVLSSCNDWLDVSPKSQIKEEEQFSREGGYKDQLTGVYTRMSSTSMYGLQMGIGFTEVLSQNYHVNANSTVWRYAAAYDYTNSNVQAIIDNIWSQSYTCIANLNILLRNIDKVDKNIFTENHYNLYKGEALGLRAFLHLDLMRLFACSPAMDNNAKGVPYITEYSTDIVPQKTVGETMQLIINDLQAARECLKSDSLLTGYKPYLQRNDRICYFNYYADVATLARAYMWAGDKENALKYANEIISVAENDSMYSRPFFWADKTNLEQSNKSLRDRAFTTEHLFNLRINKWEDVTDYYLASKGGVDALSPSEEQAQEVYEIDKGYGNDYRYLNGFDQDGEQRYASKFWYLEGGNYNNIYPLLRMTEAFYIAAECLKDSDPKRAIELLNEVREKRNLSIYPLSDNLTADEIQQEIYKEYRKEFLCEGGQLFFYYKRLNTSEIKGASTRPGKNVYVLPIPANDKEFGGYSN